MKTHFLTQARPFRGWGLISLRRGLGGGLSTLVLTFVVTLILAKSLSAQQIQIEPMQEGIDFIIQYHEAQQQQEQAALQLYKEKKWYNLLPHPGLGYNFMINRPMITLSMPDFIAYINRKNDLKYRIHKTNITAQNAITNDTIAFKAAYKELLYLIKFFNEEQILISNDSLLLQIKQEENKNLQATTEDVLKIKLSIAEKQYQHSKSIMAILSKVATLENYLHRSFRIKFSIPLSTSGEGQGVRPPPPPPGEAGRGL